MTTVISNARQELLRSLDRMEQETEVMQRRDVAEGCPGAWPTHVPLFVGEWANTQEDILLAAREAFKLGDIEYTDAGHPNGPMVRITAQGRAWWATRYAQLEKSVAGAAHEPQPEAE